MTFEIKLLSTVLRKLELKRFFLEPDAFFGQQFCEN
jgi:hypothetical protein